MESFAVLGLGQFGMTAALTLVEEGKEVMVVDQDRDKINSVKDRVVSAVVADAADRSVAEKFLSEEIDCIIVSLGQSYEASILATLYARELGVKHIITKANSPDHGKILSMVGASQVVHPSQEQARRLVSSLVRPNIVEYLPLVEGYSVVEVKTPESFVGKSLRDLDLRKSYRVEVIGIKGGEAGNEEGGLLNIIPSPDKEIPAGSSLLVMGLDKDVEKMQRG